MEPDFWHQRWQQNQIGFHQSEVNPYLRKYWQALAIAAPARILVPLCGKSLDLLWLAEQGYQVGPSAIGSSSRRGGSVSSALVNPSRRL